MRSGIGYDAHRLVEGRPLVLGGVQVPHERGLAGHSDGDVLAHATADAVLGAAAIGDIGRHFPSDDEQFRDADSIGLLRQACGLVREAGFHVVNVDATVIAEAPRIGPYVDGMRAALAAALGVQPNAVSIKATTADGLGAPADAQGIAALVIALLDST